MPAKRRRTKRPRSSATDRSGGYWFDEAAADRAVKVIERLCRHSIGEWAGKPFKLESWQRDDIVRPLFGWKRADGTRRYRIVFVSMGRKNGKSTLASAIAVLLLFADLEAGAQVYSAAADREQAAIVFDEAKRFVEASPELAKRAEVLKRSIYVPASGSVYRTLSKDSGTKHGLNPHGIIFDELHAQRTRELYDVLVTGTASRRQPITFVITTAGYDRESICYEVYQHARAVRDGSIDDDAFLPVVYELDERDDWTDESLWHKANPNLGVSVKLDYLREEAAKAKRNPAAQNTFRRLHLNQWTEQEHRAIDMNAWAACGGPIDLGQIQGATCFAALDLSSKTDITAFVLLFRLADGTVAILPHFWIPKENMVERIKRDRVPFDAWVRDGFIHATDGNVIDYTFIRKTVRELVSAFHVQEIAFDPWNATQLATQLGEEDGIPMVEHRQHFSHMSEPTQQFLAMIPAKKIRHGDNPVMAWMASNLTTKENADGNIRPIKGDKRARIDGIVAAIMALGRAISNPQPESVYERRGMVEIG